MRFNEPEVLWIFKAISDRDRYRIAVDNDCISIDECIDETNDEWDSVYVFENYGQDLIVQLFNYIGCNSDLDNYSHNPTKSLASWQFTVNDWRINI